MRGEYSRLLRAQGYSEGTITAQLHRVSRVETHHGDLDDFYERDRCRSLIQTLTYSVDDSRHGRPNPSKIPFVGDVRNNLASYKSSVLWYVRFRDTERSGPTATSIELGSQDVRVAPRGREKPDPKRTRQLAARTLADFDLDGRSAFEALIELSRYGSVAQAVASLTLFSHPVTVHQADGKAIFRSIRDQRRVGERAEIDGCPVLLDDNKSPTDAFLWANGLSRRGRDVQFNHVYAASRDPDSYTSLANICMTPAFIAKLTDTSAAVRALLRFRSFQLYGWTPKDIEPPARPDEYESLEWAAPLPAVPDLRATIERAMATKPKDRTVKAASELGWLFGAPDSPQQRPVP